MLRKKRSAGIRTSEFEQQDLAKRGTLLDDEVVGPTFRWRISIDPGVHTGICLWKSHVPIRLFAIHAPKIENDVEQTPLTRIHNIVSGIDIFLDELCQGVKIEAIAVESFSGFNAKVDQRGVFNKHHMVFHASIRGAILAHSMAWAEYVVDAGKGRISKEEARHSARCYGLRGSEHSYDALQVGIVAGFDRFGPYDPRIAAQSKRVNYLTLAPTINDVLEDVRDAVDTIQRKTRDKKMSALRKSALEAKS